MGVGSWEKGEGKGRGDVPLSKVVNNPQSPILRNNRQVPTIRRKRKRVDPLVRNLPQRHGVRLLVLRVHRLEHVHLARVVHPLPRGRRHLAAGRDGHLLVGAERRVLALLVVDDERAVHVRGQEEVLRAGDPADLGDGGVVDDALSLGLARERL